MGCPPAAPSCPVGTWGLPATALLTHFFKDRGTEPPLGARSWTQITRDLPGSCPAAQVRPVRFSGLLVPSPLPGPTVRGASCWLQPPCSQTAQGEGPPCALGRDKGPR